MSNPREQEAGSEHPLVVITEHLAEPAMRWLAEQCRVERCRTDAPAFPELLRQADGLIIRTYTTVDEAMLDRAQNLKVIGRGGVGLDNIDLDACRARKIAVVNTPHANTQAVVEYVFRLLLREVRPTTRIAAAVTAQEWNDLRSATVGRRELADMTMGILGLGRIGRRVAAIARSFDMRVIYHDIEPIPSTDRNGAEPVDVETLFGLSDVLTVHIDGRPENRGTVSERLIRLLPPEAVIINTSRGFVMDDEALATFLRENPDAVALLDVHDPEPIAATHPMLQLPNAKLFPHLASRTETAMLNMSWVVKDVWSVLSGSGVPISQR